jgi:hypothetical protein
MRSEPPPVRTKSPTITNPTTPKLTLAIEARRPWWRPRGLRSSPRSSTVPMMTATAIESPVIVML